MLSFHRDFCSGFLKGRKQFLPMPMNMPMTVGEGGFSILNRQHCVKESREYSKSTCTKMFYVFCYFVNF